MRGEDEIQFGGKLLQAQQTEKASVQVILSFLFVLLCEQGFPSAFVWICTVMLRTQEVRGALQMAAITVKECIEIFSTNTTASSMSSQPSVQSVASASHQILSKLLRDEEMIKSVSTLEVTPSSFLEALESISQEAVKEFQQFVEQSQCAGKSKQQEEKENCAENDGDNPLVQRLQGLQEVLQKERKRFVLFVICFVRFMLDSSVDPLVVGACDFNLRCVIMLLDGSVTLRGLRRRRQC